MYTKVTFWIASSWYSTALIIDFVIRGATLRPKTNYLSQYLYYTISELNLSFMLFFVHADTYFW